jgi:hypothetical protein
VKLKNPLSAVVQAVPEIVCEMVARPRLRRLLVAWAPTPTFIFIVSNLEQSWCDENTTLPTNRESEPIHTDVMGGALDQH